MTDWYGTGDCLICRLAPVVFVTNDADGRVSLYCPDCGGVYRAPDQYEFAYGDRPIDKKTLRQASRSEIERAGFLTAARRVPPPIRFP